MTSPARFNGWPWRDYGHSQMTRGQAMCEATAARRVAQSCGLLGVSDPWHVSAWVPFAQSTTKPGETKRRAVP